MTRDRFREYQESAWESRAGPGAVVVDPAALGAQFHDGMSASTAEVLAQTDEVRQSIDRLEDRIRLLAQKQVGVLSHAVPSPAQKRQLEEAIDEIKQHIAALRPRIREVDLLVRQFERSGRSGAQLRICQNQCEQLKRRLQDVLSMFNHTHVEYKRRVSQRVRRQLDLAGQSLSSVEVDRMIESNLEEVFYREVNPLSPSAQQALEDATNRHNEILRLERSIRELNELFVEVFELVAMQDRLVNNIAKNVEQAAEFTQTGRAQISRAAAYKKQAHRKKLLVGLVCLGVLVALAVLVLILVLPH